MISSAVVTMFSGWMENRTKLKTAKVDKQIKELDAASSYDLQAQKNMQNSWKDEFLILLHTLPIWGYMIPSDDLTKRLDILWLKLDQAPDYWWLIYFGIVISTFGLRFMSDRLLKSRG